MLRLLPKEKRGAEEKEAVPPAGSQTKTPARTRPRDRYSLWVLDNETSRHLFLNFENLTLKSIVKL